MSTLSLNLALESVIVAIEVLVTYSICLETNITQPENNFAQNLPIFRQLSSHSVKKPISIIDDIFNTTKLFFSSCQFRRLLAAYNIAFHWSVHRLRKRLWSVKRNLHDITQLGVNHGAESA
jgi:hypothetical protein